MYTTEGTPSTNSRRVRFAWSSATEEIETRKVTTAACNDPESTASRRELAGPGSGSSNCARKWVNTSAQPTVHSVRRALRAWRFRHTKIMTSTPTIKNVGIFSRALIRNIQGGENNGPAVTNSNQQRISRSMPERAIGVAPKLVHMHGGAMWMGRLRNEKVGKKVKAVTLVML